LLEANVIPCFSIEGTLAHIMERKPNARIAVLPEGPQTVPYISRKATRDDHSLVSE